MQILHRVRYIRDFVILFLVFVLGVNASTIGSQSDNAGIRLADDVTVRRLAEGVWLHTTYFDISGLRNVPANGLIIIDGKHVMMIDLPWTDEQSGVLFGWLAKEHDAVVEKVAPTH
jgi:hypothetical protein